MHKVLIVLFFFSSFSYSDIWTVSHDNDFMFDSDDRYTGGFFVSWSGDEYAKSEPGSYYRTYIETMNTLAGLLPLMEMEDKQKIASISLMEIMITPDDIESSVPVYDDVPYSGTLALHFSLFAWNDTELDDFHVGIGVVGPSSGAEQIQKGIHTLTGNTDPAGWDHQLGNHLIFNLGYLHGVRSYETQLTDTVKMEWFNSYFADIGNYYIGAGAGTLLRIGSNVPRNFDVSSALMSMSPTHHIDFKRALKGWGWAVKLGVYVNAMGYSYLNEEAERRGYAVEDSKWLIIEEVGFDIYYDDLQVSIEVYHPRVGSEFQSASSWGRINFTWKV